MEVIMKYKKLTPLKKMAIIVSTAMVLVAIITISQSYLSYLEVKDAADGCYDKGGFPTIEKSGLNIEYFECNMD
jgi:hypothetical protein